MTPEQAGIQHFSPSSLNKYISSPGLWARQYLGGVKEGGNPKMWRGSAVEDGYAAYLRKGNLDEAYDATIRRYDLEIANASVSAFDPVVKQRGLLEPMLSQALLWTPPSELNATQIKVEHWFDDVPVPVKGYVDLAFEGLDVDLKTKEKLMQPSASEIRQVSLYRAARQRAGGLLIVTDKRYAYHEVTDEMMEKGLAELHDAARKVTKLLAAFEKPQDILDVLPIDWDHWMAPKQTAPKTTSAADDFVVVALEN